MTQFFKSYIICVILSLSWVWGDCEDGEVELWGECYNIEETTFLQLSWNGLTGEIPPTIGNLTNLTKLWLYSNELIGEIPSTIGSLTNLTEFYLWENQLTGEIPPEIGNLINLDGIDLHSNQFTGEIPSTVGNLTNLTYLNLSLNELTGEIPESICNLTIDFSIYNFHIEDNQFCPPYPSCIEDYVGEQDTTNCNNGSDCTADDGTDGVELWGECYSIENTTELDLSYIGLTGEIPPEIGNLINLSSLILKENQLSGEIPPVISYLTNLTQLDLGGNQFTGAIPPEIGSLTNLNILDLAGNQLTGALPPEIGNLANLTELELGGNQVMGAIPPEIGNLESLTFIHLEYNQFTSEIPAEIGNLTNLVWLNFVHNQLTGEIPSSICNLDMNWSNPDNFNIYYNQLCPPYPSCVEDYVGEQDTTNCGQGNVTVDYQLDWNLVGLPLDVEDASYTILFPESIEGTLYSFEDGYISESYLTLGKGYWLRFIGAGSTTITGSPISELTITLTEGWNLISGITNFVDVSDIQDPSGIIIPGTVYGFSFNGYSNAESIEPGKGYWLRTYQSGDIILTSQTPATVTDIDGNVYNTVSIGDQLWMAENLKVTHYQNGDEIPYSYNDPQYGAYAEYSNDASNVAVYGRLYNWFAVNDARGLCPVDWQVPSDDELQELEMHLGMSESEANSEGLRGTDEGGKLKEEGTEHWNSPNTGATNETGFTALPGGRRDYDSYTDQEVWCCLNRYGFFWSSSEIYSVNAWYRALSFDYAESNRYHLNKRNGFSVRCIRDDIAMTGGPLIKDLHQTFNLTGKANSLTVNGMDLYFGVEMSARERLSYSLPPKPPMGAFDVRFKGDTRIAEEHAEIEVMSPYETITISYDIIIDAGEHMNWILTSETGKDYIMEGSGELTIPSAESFTLALKAVVPATFTLHQNYPNPFNPVTTLRYDLPKQAFVNITIYDMLGREITQLVNTSQEAGFKSVQWDAKDSMGRPVSAGVYLYQIQAGEFVQTKKMVLLK